MLTIFQPIFEATPVQKPQQNNQQKNLKNAQDIINQNRQGPDIKTNVNINPSSTMEMSRQSANSASNAANRFSNQSNSAGQRINSLTNQYNKKPSQGKLNSNPTLMSKGI